MEFSTIDFTSDMDSLHINHPIDNAQQRKAAWNSLALLRAIALLSLDNRMRVAILTC